MSGAIFIVALICQLPASSSLDVVVRPTEIDSKNHLNHAKAIEYLQWGRWDWLDVQNLSDERLRGEMGTVLVVVNINIDYRQECLRGEKLKVVTSVEKVGEKSFTFRQEIRKPDGSVAISGTVTLVAIDPAIRKSRPLPADLANALKGPEGAQP